MAVVVYSKAGDGTGQKLAAALGVEANLDSDILYQEKLVGWGATQAITSRKRLNKAAAVRVASRKVGLWEMLGAEGMPTPQLATLEDYGKKIILWRTQNHAAGTDIVVQEIGEEIPTFIDGRIHYPVVYVPNDGEYRIWVWKGEVILAQRKWKTIAPCHEWIRSHWAWEGFTPQDLASPLYTNATNTVKLCGLDFGAVDVLRATNVSREKRYVVLEVNTAPVLREEDSLPLFVERIKGWMEE